MPGGTDVI